MKWFTGGIAEAVQCSKQKGAIFVVYVEGKDEQSLKITDLINNGEAGKKLETEDFVAIKIEAESVPHQQFIEIFNERRVPLLYFIGKSGTCLDAITGADDLELLSTRIETILQKTGTVSPSSSANLIRSEQSTSAQKEVVCEDGVCRIKSDPSGTSSSPQEEGETLTSEEKVERAKELIQKKKEEKEREEKENERLKEIERRKMGQNVQQLKKWQEDQELKQLKEERDREKREQQQARERVLAQIAQDKAERLAKSAPVPETNRQVAAPPSPPPKLNDNSTRLQFKFPDGSTVTQEFAISDTLDTVIAYIKGNVKLSYSNFKLSTTFPRREFTENDYSQSLLDLQLCPTAVILVLPVNSGVVSTNQGSGLTNMVWALFAPLFHIFGMIKNFIFGNRNQNVVGKRTQTAEPPNQPENPRQRMRDSTVIRRQGNVHRLGDRRDSDEDGNTWNGNSTQQM